MIFGLHEPIFRNFNELEAEVRIKVLGLGREYLLLDDTEADATYAQPAKMQKA